jgi:hypothetical protein
MERKIDVGTQGIRGPGNESGVPVIYKNGDGSFNRTRVLEQIIGGVIIGVVLAGFSILYTIPRIEGKIEKLTVVVDANRQISEERSVNNRRDLHMHSELSSERAHGKK